MGNNIGNNYREEVQNGDYPDSLSTEQMNQALFQMENCICKIIVDEKGEKLGTGFFCKIPFPNEFHTLPVLITCNHVLDSSSIAKGKKITFSFNKEKKKIRSILIDESRKCLSDKDNDFTIIEIKEDDSIYERIEFLNIDQWITKFKPDNYNNQTIYIIHFEKGEEAKYSIGKIKNIALDNYKINYLCSTKEGSSGGPIINLLFFGVMGIHKGGSPERNGTNSGLLMKVLIDKFNDKYKNKFYISKYNDDKKENSENNTDVAENVVEAGSGQKIPKIPEPNIKIKYNNIIYYENKINKSYFSLINKNYKKNANIYFITCNNIISLKLIIDEIINENKIKEDKIFFNLIIENNYTEIIELLKYNKEFLNLIKNIIINNEKYINNFENIFLNSKYFSSDKDIINFINKTSSDEIKPFQIIKVITYEDYLSDYTNFHYEISKYYGDFNPKNFEKNVEKINLLIENDWKNKELSNMDKDKLLDGLLKFGIKDDGEKLEDKEIIIREYTKNNFYKDLNRWLTIYGDIKNPEEGYYDAISYFASRLMFSLNSFAKENKMYCEENGKYLYKGFFLSYISLLEYKKAKGKIILFSTFISTIENEQNVKGLLKFKSDSKFGVIFIIKNIYKKGWVSNVINIQSASLYNEREFVILPFSFFLVKDVQIKTKDYTAKIYLETIGKTEILENKIKIGKKIRYNEKKKIMEIKK